MDVDRCTWVGCIGMCVWSEVGWDWVWECIMGMVDWGCCIVCMGRCGGVWCDRCWYCVMCCCRWD